jgi:hypothetical protein
MGLAKTFTANSAGELYLGVNDIIFGDNSGSWTATVTFNKGQSGAYSNIPEYPVPTADHSSTSCWKPSVSSMVATGNKPP